MISQAETQAKIASQGLEDGQARHRRHPTVAVAAVAVDVEQRLQLPLLVQHEHLRRINYEDRNAFMQDSSLGSKGDKRVTRH